MELLSLSWIRDLVVVVAGIIWLPVGLLVLAIAAAIFWFGRKGMAAAHRALDVRGVKQLKRLQTLAEQLQERTAKLPGAPGSEAGATELIATAQGLRDMDPPFRRKIKSWRPF